MAYGYSRGSSPSSITSSESESTYTYNSCYHYTPTSFTPHEQSRDALATLLSFGGTNRSRLPPGFPFRLNIVPHGSGSIISYDSYEFLEELRTRSGHRISVKFEFTKPPSSQSSSSNSSKCFTWRIYPHDARFHSYMSTTHNTPLAHVQVDPSVMDTNYGKHIRHDHRVITSALALSMNLDAVITICEAKALRSSKRFPQLRQSIKHPGPFHSKEILYVATGSEGFSHPSNDLNTIEKPLNQYTPLDVLSSPCDHHNDPLTYHSHFDVFLP
ncbi:hypothetical protein L218DRAFT_421685 [Marasmius fiardii PR-910]|nr:hypothetical protein L218DRAFT_421685 [Marasmius fiardii PR-910]